MLEQKEEIKVYLEKQVHKPGKKDLTLKHLNEKEGLIK